MAKNDDANPPKGIPTDKSALIQLGAELRFARKQSALTQADVGAKAGFSRQLVNRIENGHNCEIAAFVAVAAAVGRRLTITEDPAREGEQAGLDLILRLPE